MTKTQQLLLHTFPDFAWQFDVPLAPKTYLKIGGPAETLLSLGDEESIQKLLHFVHQHHIPLKVLGGASNVIIDDAGVPGIVLYIENTNIEPLALENDEEKIIRAGAGTKMALLVAKVVDLGYTGLEYFLGVPGTVGGAVYNNAHYLSDLISEHVHAVTAIDTQGKFHRYTKEECSFAYEQSRFQTTGEIIFSTDFLVRKGIKKDSQEKIKHATEYRSQTQPLGIPSSGCIFQNCPNTDQLKTQFPDFAHTGFVPAGYIIDKAGLKGERVGGISVSTKHAAWFVNDGTGTSADVKKLIQTVKQKVAQKYAIELHEEVFYVGGKILERG